MRVELSLTYVYSIAPPFFTKDPGHGRKGSLDDAIQARKASDFLPFTFLLRIPGSPLPGTFFLQAAREGKKLCSRMGVGESLEFTCSWGWPVNSW